MLRLRPWTTVTLLVVAVATACRPAAPPVLTVVHFSDIGELGPVDGGRTGGLARLATLIGDLRREGPVLVTLGGDFLSPSAIGTAQLDGEPLAGRQTVAVLNALDLDVATFGNHEFDLSESLFRQRLGEAEFAVVSSNVTDASGARFEDTSPSTIIPVTVGSRTLDIGFVGLTIAFNLTPYVMYGAPIESARSEAQALVDETDAIIALTHQAMATDQELAAAVPEIDLVLGGHEHENSHVSRGAALTPIVKADANLRSVAIVRMVFADAGERPSITVRHAPLTEAIALDPLVDAEVRRWLTVGFEAFRDSGFEPERVVTTVGAPLDGREAVVRNTPSSLASVITAAMAREVDDADVVVLNGGSIRIDDIVKAGPLTEYDVIRMLPFGGSVLSASIQGSLLSDILDVGVANRGSGGYLQTWGVTRDENRWLVQGEAIVESRRYVVAMPEFLMTGGESRLGFLTPENPRIRNITEFRDVRRVLIDELVARSGESGG